MSDKKVDIISRFYRREIQVEFKTLNKRKNYATQARYVNRDKLLDNNKSREYCCKAFL